MEPMSLLQSRPKHIVLGVSKVTSPLALLAKKSDAILGLVVDNGASDDGHLASGLTAALSVRDK